MLKMTDGLFGKMMLSLKSSKQYTLYMLRDNQIRYLRYNISSVFSEIAFIGHFNSSRYLR